MLRGSPSPLSRMVRFKRPGSLGISVTHTHTVPSLRDACLQAFMASSLRIRATRPAQSVGMTIGVAAVNSRSRAVTWAHSADAAEVHCQVNVSNVEAAGERLMSLGDDGYPAWLSLAAGPLGLDSSTLHNSAWSPSAQTRTASLSRSWSGTPCRCYRCRQRRPSGFLPRLPLLD